MIYLKNQVFNKCGERVYIDDPYPQNYDDGKVINHHFLNTVNCTNPERESSIFIEGYFSGCSSTNDNNSLENFNMSGILVYQDDQDDLDFDFYEDIYDHHCNDDDDDIDEDTIYEYIDDDDSDDELLYYVDPNYVEEASDDEPLDYIDFSYVKEASDDKDDE